MKVLVIYKRSTYSFYRESPEERVRTFIQSDHPKAQRMREGHDTNERSLEIVIGELTHRGIAYDAMHRSTVQETDRYDLVIAVGGDGTVLDASHHMRDTPLLGVNSSPGRSVGHYCSCTAAEFGETFSQLKTLSRNQFPRIEAVIDGVAVPELALNEVAFAHINFAATTLYELDGATHLDSGIIACAAGGSTAWMRKQGGEVMGLDDDRLQYKPHAHAVPTQYATEVHIESFTREARIAIDGEHTSYVVGLGQTLVLRRGPPITILGDIRKRYGQ